MSLLRTPLFEEHVRAGGKIVPFAGYEMPVQYQPGITVEHNAVRTGAGLFDVSHMGEFEVSGPRALDFIQYLTTNDASKLEVGQAQYSTLPKEDGTLLDDLIVYRLDGRYLIVVNASNREKDFDWMSQYAPKFDAKLVDVSDNYALLALQGPRAAEILARLTDTPLDQIGYYRFAEGSVDGMQAIISRTGYTGEDGFEIFLGNDDAAAVWRRILHVGAPEGVMPVGLGARDSLRLEMGYALYGNDLDESRNPLEAGLGWVTKLDKDPFLAGDALRRIKENGTSQRLVGFRLTERGFPRHGYEIAHQGEVVGTVTSGTMSPTLGVGIGMGYVPTALAAPGTTIDILIRSQPIPAEVVRPPFYKSGSIKR